MIMILRTITGRGDSDISDGGLSVNDVLKR